MRLIKLLFLFYYFPYLFGQYQVLSNKDRKPVPYVFIYTSGGKSTFSDENGRFSIFVTSEDTLYFQCLGYKSHLFLGKELLEKGKVFLESQEIALDEVLISEKRKARKHSWFGIKGPWNYGYAFMPGVQVYQFVKNEKKSRGKVTYIRIHLYGVLRIKYNKKGQRVAQSLDKISKDEPCFLLVNLLNTSGKEPRKELLDQDMAVHISSVRTRRITIPVKDYNITFPEEGLWVRMKLDCFCKDPLVKNMILYRGRKEGEPAYAFKRKNSSKVQFHSRKGVLGVQVKVFY